MIKKQFLIILSLCIFVFGSFFCQVSKSEAQEPIRIRFAHLARPDVALGIRIQAFVDRVNELCKGKVIVENHHSGKLVVETAAARAAIQGNIEMGSTGSGNLTPFTSVYQFLELPFLVNNMEDVITKILGGPIGKEIGKEVEKKVGLKVLMYSPSGQGQQITNTKREVRLPKDLHGLKIRTRPSKLEMAIVRACGGAPTPVDWAEIFTAVQQGTVDGLVSQFLWIDTTKLSEVIKYIVQVNVNFPVHVSYMNLKFWNKLPSDIQNNILKAAAETEPLVLKVDKQQEEQIKKRLQKAGVSIYVPTPNEKAVWVKKASVVYDEVKDKISPEFIKRVKDSVK